MENINNNFSINTLNESGKCFYAMSDAALNSPRLNLYLDIDCNGDKEAIENEFNLLNKKDNSCLLISTVFDLGNVDIDNVDKKVLFDNIQSSIASNILEVSLKLNGSIIDKNIHFVSKSDNSKYVCSVLQGLGYEMDVIDYNDLLSQTTTFNEIATNPKAVVNKELHVDDSIEKVIGPNIIRTKKKSLNSNAGFVNITLLSLLLSGLFLISLEISKFILLSYR